jgi:hypothetical protein
MVAALSANQAVDVRLASKLGSLLHAHTQIRDPRWRLDAVVRIHATLRRYHVASDRLRGVAQQAVAQAPSPIRDRLAEQLFDAFDTGGGDALSMLVDALWHHDHASSQIAAVRGLLALGEHERARSFASTERRYLGPKLELVLRHGFDPREPAPRFVGDVAAWESFAPSLPLLAALVEANRRSEAERVLAQLPDRTRWMGVGHVARLDLDLSLVRSLRCESRRDASTLLLVRHALAAGLVDRARACAAAIRRPLGAQRARLDIARALVGRKQTREAYDLLRHVRDPRLWAGNVVLRNEIRLARGVGREWERVRMPRGSLAAFREVPAWLDLEGSTRLSVRDDLVIAVSLLQLGIRSREEGLTRDASRRVRRRSGERSHRRACLSLLDASGLERGQAMVPLACDALTAEWIAVQLERVACATTTTNAASPSSLTRALDDEGVALSSDAGRRRRVLIDVARSSLRSALRDPAAVPAEVVETRLRTLVHLGGELGADAIGKSLASLPVRGVTSTRAIEALCKLEPRAASAIVLGRLAEMRAGGVEIDQVLAVAEQHGGLDAGFARAFTAAHRNLVRALGGEQTDDWLTGFLSAWRERFGRLPGAAALDGLAERTHVPVVPASLWEDFAALAIIHAGDSHVERARRLATDEALLFGLQLARPERIAPDLKPWSLLEWRKRLSYAASGVSVNTSAVHRFARLHGYRAQFEALARGDLSALGVTGAHLTSDGQELRIRLLDKRADILTYLRFADATVRTCFRSSSSFYESPRYMTIDGLVDVWKDPLTFCFQIERRIGDRFVACGFCFGGFAELADELAILVNGIHVRPNSPAIRRDIVAMLEQNLCHPLGIEQLGIGCAHSARGPLPAGYEPRQVRLRRLRATDHEGMPVQRCNDDISRKVNQVVQVGGLFWRTTARPPR